MSNRPASPRGGPLEGETAPGATRLLALVRRWRVVLAAAAVTAGLVGFVVASSTTPTYEASAVVLVGPTNTDLDTLRAAGQLAQTYAQLATSRPLIAATERRLGVRALGSEVTASASGVTRLLTVRVRDRDAARGARIANAHAAELVALADRRRTRTPGPGSLEIVDPAEAASSPSGPGAMPIALVAGLMGLLGALALALLVDRSGDVLRGRQDVPVLTGAGAVAVLSPRASRAAAHPPLVARAPGSRAAEEYRLLAARLRAVGERRLVLLQVDDRATGVMANIAAAMTEGGARVALLDVERDRVTELGPGMRPVVSDVALADVVDGDDARQVLDEYAAADVILVDAPPLERSSGGLAWASVADAALMAGQVDRTRRSDLAAAAESLRLVHARLLGTIVGAPPGCCPGEAAAGAPRRDRAGRAGPGSADPAGPGMTAGTSRRRTRASRTRLMSGPVDHHATATSPAGCPGEAASGAPRRAAPGAGRAGAADVRARSTITRQRPRRRAAPARRRPAPRAGLRRARGARVG